MAPRELLLSKKEAKEIVPAFDEHILFSLERRYLDFLQPARMELTVNPVLGSFDLLTDLHMFQIQEVNYADRTGLGLHLMQFQNILASMKDDSHNIIAMIRGEGQIANFYYGFARRRDQIQYSEGVATHNFAQMFNYVIRSNYMGTKTVHLDANALQRNVMPSMLEHRYILALPGIPSLRNTNGPYVQGIDRFVEAMHGHKYVLLCIAEPISSPEVDAMIKNLFDLSTSVHSSVKATVQKLRGSSDTINVGMFGMGGSMDGVATSTADTTGATYLGGAGSIGLIGGTIGAVVGSIVPGVGTLIGSGIGSGIGTALGTLTGAAFGLPLAKLTSFTSSVAHSVGSVIGGGLTGGYARSWNRSMAVSQEVLNKTAEYCERLCETYIARLQRGKNLGFWNVGIYLLTSDKYAQICGGGMLRACFSGDETYWEPMRALPVQDDATRVWLSTFNNPRYDLLRFGAERGQVEEALGQWMKFRQAAEVVCKGDIRAAWKILTDTEDNSYKTDLLEAIRREPAKCSEDDIDKAWKEVREADLGHPLGPALGGVSTPLNTDELSIIMNLPRQEVQGITLRETAAFGANYSRNIIDGVELGNLIHKREPLKGIPFSLPKTVFQRHAFVCGVTGSGKTNTCFALLRALDMPFLVIEPAKSEYRQLMRALPNLLVYTLGNENVSPFRLNPFEFPPGGHLLTHIDTLKAVFNASFPMYASMPYLLEEAIVEVYRDKGWELATSANDYLDSDGLNNRYHDFLPTLQDLYNKIKIVVERKQYAQELTMNMRAALQARLSSLLTGSKGLMLNSRRSTPLGELLDRQVVLELKHIGDDDEKCFIMGLILSRIYEYREVEGIVDSPLRHQILIEEAHRLLKHVPEYVSPEIANSRGKAVETFANVISEIRAYGEGVVVVDQIPAKLAQDIVKNTCVKIVHRTLARDDRETLGATMSLSTAQANELPLLGIGQAVIHSEEFDKPYLVQVQHTKRTCGDRVKDTDVKDRMGRIQKQHAAIFRRYPGFEKNPEVANAFNRMDFREPVSEIYLAIPAAAGLFLSGATDSCGRFGKEAESTIRNILRVTEAAEVDAHVIWNVNLFFEKLNEAFPRNVDHCVYAQQAFVDLWFSEGGDAEALQIFRTAMRRIVRPKDPLVYMMEVFLAKKSHYAEAFRAITLDYMKDNLYIVDDMLCKALDAFLLGITPTSECKLALLQAGLQKLSQGLAAIQWYRDHYQELL